MEELLDAAGVCSQIPGMTPALLAQMRYRGDGPMFLKPTARKVVYRKSDIERWLTSREQQSTRENRS